MKVVLSGGGTGGSVTPLLAVAQKIKEISKEEPEFLWLGTRKGPEKKLVKHHNVKFRAVCSGKFRRYFSWRNFIDPLLILIGFLQSLFILVRFRPDIILSAGSFVSVPIVWVGWFLGIPSVIHQQDIRAGLANKLMAPAAKIITITFEKSIKKFPRRKTHWTGNPVRPEILKGRINRAKKQFKLENNLPTLLVIGGGTGALALNQLIGQIVPELVKFCQIIHLTGGRGKFKDLDNYHHYKFLTKEMADAYAVADLVVSRAGMGVLTELANLGKPVILMPIPGSHQMANAQYFVDQQAAIVLDQDEISAETLLEQIEELISDKERLKTLGKDIKSLARPDAAEAIAKITLGLIS